MPAARLLLPIDATAPTRAALRHVLRRAAAGEALQVCLLYTVAPVASGEVLRFRSERQQSEFAQHQATAFLREASAELSQSGVPCDTLWREADPGFCALDLAEELGCTEIVIARPEWFEWFSAPLAQRLRRSARSVPVTLVNAKGDVVTG